MGRNMATVWQNEGKFAQIGKGVFEIFVVNSEIEEMIYHNVSIVELRKKAREMGMRSMREDGFRKVLAGVTTLDEVLMVTTEEE